MNNTDKAIRDDFPIFGNISGVYLDNAATSQKPQCVIDAEKTFYETINSNPMRGFYEISLAATKAVEDARNAVRRFINAESEKEIIFTTNSTSAINLAAYSLSAELTPCDRIVVSVAEHHSNMLPWREASRRTGAELVYMMCDEKGSFHEDEIERCITENTKIVAIGVVSNVTGARPPLEKIINAAHSVGAVVLADGAQSVPHEKTDVQALDIDLLAFSAHKMLGPMGVGVLYGKRKLLEKMPPFMTGGEMIESVTLGGEVYAELPHKFEAGTLNAAGIHAFKSAIDYYEKTDTDAIRQRELELTKYAFDGLSRIKNVRILGSEDYADHSGILSFTVDGVHPHDVSEILSADGICIRAGHHCAQPLLHHLGVYSSSRASLMLYNTTDEIDRFLHSVSTIRERMGYR